MDCFHYTTVLFKNPSFSVKYFIKKPFSKMPKGWNVLAPPIGKL